MDYFIAIGYIVILVIVVIYCIIILTYNYRNSQGSVQPTGSPSIVTHTKIGDRGDMGNQIFQVATLFSAAKKSNATPVIPTKVKKLPISELFDLSSIKSADIIPRVTIREHNNYEEIIIPQDGRIYNIAGYRQAYKYFDEHSDDIRKLFTPRPEIIDPLRQALPENYIAVHIRRGDYIKTIHKIPLCKEFKRCQLEYYKSGIELLRKAHPGLPLLVCTDSPTWVQPLLKELDAELAPTIDNISPKFTDFCTLYLANGIVMSNSTYSWMAAYLNPNNTVVCPTPWWDPDGFIGSGMGLDGPYLHYPTWWLLDADNGKLIREANSTIGDREDTNEHTLTFFKLLRGCL